MSVQIIGFSKAKWTRPLARCKIIELGYSGVRIVEKEDGFSFNVGGPQRQGTQYTRESKGNGIVYYYKKERDDAEKGDKGRSGGSIKRNAKGQYVKA